MKPLLWVVRGSRKARRKACGGGGRRRHRLGVLFRAADRAEALLGPSRWAPSCSARAGIRAPPTPASTMCATRRTIRRRTKGRVSDREAAPQPDRGERSWRRLAGRAGRARLGSRPAGRRRGSGASRAGARSTSGRAACGGRCGGDRAAPADLRPRRRRTGDRAGGPGRDRHLRRRGQSGSGLVPHADPTGGDHADATAPTSRRRG